MRIYRCSFYEAYTGYCGGRQIRAEEVETWAWEEVAAIIRDPERVAAELKRRQEEGPAPTLVAEAKTARCQVAECERQIQRLIRKFAAAQDDSLERIFDRQLESLQAEQARWTKQAEEAERRLHQSQVEHDSLERLYLYCRRVQRKLNTLSFERKCQPLEAFEVRIAGNGQEWSLYGNTPDPQDDLAQKNAGGRSEARITRFAASCGVRIG